MRTWNLSYESLTSFDAREKLRSLKAEDPMFWDELTMNKQDTNLPEPDADVPEDDMDAELACDSGFGDDSSVTIADVVRATTGALRSTSRVADREGGGLVPMDLAENEDEEPVGATNGDGDGRDEEAGGSTAAFPQLAEIPTSIIVDSTSAVTATGRGKRKRTQNKWYSSKDFIRHDDNNDSDVE